LSITVTTDVFCDRCVNWVDGLSGVQAFRKEARRIAASQGWVRRRDDKGRLLDLCPDCAKPLEPERSPAPGAGGGEGC
jgi:hypothetical protein